MTEDNIDTSMSAQAAIEMILSHRAATEPGFVEKVVLAPKETVAPIIAEVLEDDGSLDLSDVAINVHVATPKSLHFVLTPEDVEVSGFNLGSGGINVRILGSVFPPILGADQTPKHTDTCTSTGGENDAKCTPASFKSF